MNQKMKYMLHNIILNYTDSSHKIKSYAILICCPALKSYSEIKLKAGNGECDENYKINVLTFVILWGTFVPQLV